MSLNSLYSVLLVILVVYCALALYIFLMQYLDFTQMLSQCFPVAVWQGYDAILLAFGVPNHNLMVIKVNVMNPQAHALHQPQATPIKKAGHQCKRGLFYSVQQPFHFRT